MTKPDPALPAGLPASSRIHRIAFTTESSLGQIVLVEFPTVIGRRAVAVGTDSAPKGAGDELLVLIVPESGEEDSTPLAQMREWADPPTVGWERTGQLITLQGAQVVWTPTRIAVMAAADRLPTVQKAVVEIAYYDAELRSIEKELAALWPDLEADTPLAFEFAEKSVRHRRRLAERFRQVLLLRARLARITPYVLEPHVHPPTLASQLSERLRERGRMAYRLEALSDQIEVFERVYEGCGNKVSEFMAARTGHILEWVIILLLLMQTLVLGVELLSR